MRRFKNTLVGVDLANDDQLVGDKLTIATRTAVENGRWLGKQSDAKLVFLNVLEIPNYMHLVSEVDCDVESSLVADSRDRLARFSQQATALGIDAEYGLALGKSWVELIRHAQKHRHDLVISGTREQGTIASALFGSTGMKLLRKCLCPVWITKRHETQEVDSILVAADLSPVSALILELGVSIADMFDAQLHVLHVLQLGLGRPEWDSYRIRQRARAEATEILERQLAIANAASLRKPVNTRIVVDAADVAILKSIEQNHIELLLMGTVARGGITGVLTGNTAERLLPRIPCSVLAVKPHDFVCPIGIN